MGVTVRQLFELDLMREKVTLVTGEGGLDRDVSFVTIMEAPDFYEWVDGGEFVLTTWYAFSEHPELQMNAFLQLADKIAALAIKTDRFIERVPDEILALAEEKQVPVFTIQRDTKFREIVQAIAGALNNYQANILIEVDRYYQSLVKTALADDDLSALLNEFGQRTRLNCWCIDHNGRVLASFEQGSNNGLPGGEALVAAILRWSAEPIACFHEMDCHVFPCQARQLSLGYLVVHYPGQLSEKFRLMANNLVAFLTLKLLDKTETQQKNLGYLLDDLLYHHRLTEKQIQERLTAFGLKRSPFYRVFVVVAASSLQNDSLALLRNYARSLQRAIRDAIIVVRAKEVVVIAGSTADDSAISQSRSWKKKIVLRDEDVAKGVLVGVGPAVRKASDLAYSYRMARQTIRAARPADGTGGIFFYWDYMVQNLLAQGLDSPEYRTFFDQIIAPLTQERKNITLMDTLSAVAFADDLQDAAERMNVHINTVRYRLRRIMELTGHDFFSPAGRYVLTTACLLFAAGGTRK